MKTLAAIAGVLILSIITPALYFALGWASGYVLNLLFGETLRSTINDVAGKELLTASNLPVLTGSLCAIIGIFRMASGNVFSFSKKDN